MKNERYKEFVMHFDMTQPYDKLIYLSLRETSKQTGFSKEDIAFSLIFNKIMKKYFKFVKNGEKFDLNLLKNCVEVDLEA